MLYYVRSAIYVIVCLVLMLVVLLQQGKGGDIANAFGGGASQAAFGARSGATVLSRATTVCAVLFIVGALRSASLPVSAGPGIGGRRTRGPAGRDERPAPRRRPPSAGARRRRRHPAPAPAHPKPVRSRKADL